MKQKIVIKVQMTCQKCKSKAMKIAVKADGVTKVEIEGEEKDKLVVIGEGVDSVKLTRALRKRLPFAMLLTVEEQKKESKEKEATPIQWSSIDYCLQWPMQNQIVAYDPNPSGCSIL